MKQWWLRLAALVLSLSLIVPAVPARAYEKGRPFQQDLSLWIQNQQRREYVQMMLDYYIRNDPMVASALDGGFSAVFLFDGCSDNLDDPLLSDLSYYRVSGICLVVQKDAAGELALTYFNDDCSTIPDRPLAYGAWKLPKVGEVGPATVCDGTYQLYSVYHKGRYEALNARTEYYDGKLDAVYMTEEGFVPARATEINVHTRTGNHILNRGMWSAGCPLVGDGDNWEFWKLVDRVYYSNFDQFELDTFVGTLTIDRQCLRQQMYQLYENQDAVDMILSRSRQLQPEKYLQRCREEEAFQEPLTLQVRSQTTLMSLPCSNATDARSREQAVIQPGEKLKAQRLLTNSVGSQWYQVEAGGQLCYLYSADAKPMTWLERILDWIF